MAKQQAIDGRQALAWLLEPTGTEVNTALAVGDIVFITAKASSSSIFGDVPTFKPFIATKALTPATGDKYVKCNPYFMGFATDKSLNKSKNTSEVTMDYDESQAYVTDGITQISGSVSGSFVIEGAKYATTIIKRRFGDVMEISGEGVATLHAAQTTEKDILMFVWNARDAKVGDDMEIEIVPALITSMAIGGSYGSPQTFNLDFTGNSTDENGYSGATIQVKNVAGLLPAFTRAGADAQAAV